MNFLEHVLHGLVVRCATPSAPKHVVSVRWRTASFTPAVRGHLRQRFGQMWNGRGGSITIPVRSPDLNTLDYFPWGDMKSLVYETPVDSEEDLLTRVMVAADVGLHRIDDHVYETCYVGVLYVLKALVVTSSPSCKWTQKKTK